MRNPSLTSVSQVSRGPAERLWLATPYGIYIVDATGKITAHYSTEHGLPDNAVRAILYDRKGNLWIGTRAGLAIYLPEQNRFEEIIAGQQTQDTRLYVRTLFEADDGNILVGTNNSGLWRIDSTTLNLQSALSGIPLNYQTGPVFDVMQFSDNELWLARFGGIDRIEADTGEWKSRILFDPSDPFSLSNNDIRTLLKDQAGTIWVAGYGGGLQRMLNNTNGVQTVRFSLLRENALSEPNVSSVLTVSNGQIWIGTRGGGIDIYAPGQGCSCRILSATPV